MLNKIKTLHMFVLLIAISTCLSGCQQENVLEGALSSTNTEGILIEQILTTEEDADEIESQLDDTQNQMEDEEEAGEEVEETEDLVDETAATDVNKINWEEGEPYYYMLEGEWAITEYAGMISDYGFDEANEEGYMESEQEYTNGIINENMNREFRIEMDNLETIAPVDDWYYVMEDDEALFNVTRFAHLDYEMTSPYIGVYLIFKDEDAGYDFIIDSTGIVLVEIDYRFFRLERK